MPREDVARSLYPRILEMDVVSPRFYQVLHKRIPEIRPITLVEVLRKLWTGLLVDEVTSSSL